MPLKFRSVVPYTLPGVIGLIGWWWYISRKKEQLITCAAKDGTQTTLGLKESQVEAGSGVREKGTASSENGTEVTTHRPYKVTNQIFENENNFNVQVQNTEAAPLLEQSSEQAIQSCGRIRDGKGHKSSAMSTDKDDKLHESLSQHKIPELENHLVQTSSSAQIEVVMPCRSTVITQSTPTKAHLSDVERPEPEGEVAKHYSINAQNGTVSSVIQQNKRATLSEADYLEMPPLVQDFHSHILTSTPSAFAQTSTALTVVQNTITTSVTPEDFQIHRSGREQQDLELLAAGLITEVISAATQEVLGVTNCEITDGNHPSCNSTIQCDSRICSQKESITAIQKHPNVLKNVSLTYYESTETTQKKGEQTYNGCSLVPVSRPVEVSQRDIQKKLAQRGLGLTLSNPTVQIIPLPNTKLNGDNVTVLACSTYHSEDYSSSEDLQSSMFDNPVDVIQVKDFSATKVEQSQSLLEATNEAPILTLAAEDSVGDICEIKSFNGLELRNGAWATYGVDVEHSGGSDVNSMDSVDSGCTIGAGESPSSQTASLNCEVLIWEIEVPKHLVGRLIGKQGRYVSFLKQTSGAKIYISTLPYTQEFQICHIEGKQQDIDKALSLIGKKFKDLDLTNVYAPQPLPLSLPSLPMTSWLLLPSGVTVEVIVVNIVSAGHIFVQQHTHPTYHALRSLDQQMFLCYSQPGTPALPSPAEAGVICAAPAGGEGAWWRAQVIAFYKETTEVEIRYVDYGGYDRVKIDLLRQIRSDFVTLPFQGAEVLLDNITPLPGEDRFSEDATSALEEMTRGVALLAQVSNYDNNTGLPLVHLWNMVGDKAISVNRTLADKGLGSWVDGF